jgi:antitoxin (DNA-binding transcriptional repressor) of toxin-antitoxin stability system
MATTVGVREFRENLATHLESEEPVAITRHGDTIGHYVPAPRRQWTKEDWAESDARQVIIQKMLKDAGITAEELLEDFMQMHRQGNAE